MSVLVNRNTTQAPMSAAGNTGAQVLKFIDAPRIYIKTTAGLPVTDPITATPVQNYYNKSKGVTPTGWTDLGVVENKAKISVEKKVKEVKTGIDNYFRTAYTSEKMGKVEFTLDQFDDVVLSAVTGISASVISAGSVVAYPVGSEDLAQAALMLVSQNKLDGKEIQFYNPAAFLNFGFDASGDQLVLKATGWLPFFVPAGATAEEFLHVTVYNAAL